MPDTLIRPARLRCRWHAWCARTRASRPATIEAARHLLHASMAMTLISARPPSGILPLAEKLGLVHPLGAFNGGTIVMPDGTMIVAHRIAAETKPHRDGAGREKRRFALGLRRWQMVRPRRRTIRTIATSARPLWSIPSSRMISRHCTGRIDKIVGVSDDAALMAKLTDEVAGGARRPGQRHQLADLLLRHHPHRFAQQGGWHRLALRGRSASRSPRRRRSATCQRQSRC